MIDDLHPDFVSCAEDARWKGKLDALFIELTREAAKSYVSEENIELDRGWYWRVLRHGAFVGMRKRADVRPASAQRFELRLARSGELKVEVEDRWKAEVATFLKHFNIEATEGRTPAAAPGRYWLRLPPQERDIGKPVVRLLSLALGEVRPGKALCHDCLQKDPPVEFEVEWHPSYGVRGQACNPCALLRGERERRERTSAPATQSTLPL